MNNNPSPKARAASVAASAEMARFFFQPALRYLQLCNILKYFLDFNFYPCLAAVILMGLHRFQRLADVPQARPINALGLETQESPVIETRLGFMAKYLSGGQM